MGKIEVVAGRWAGLSPWLAAAGLVVCMTAAGCALAGGPETLTITPDAPTLGASRRTRYGISSLVVVTSTYLELALGDTDEGTHVHHTGYTLYDVQGKRIDYVRNHVGVQDREPTVVELEPGRYLVLLDDPGKHPPQFRVVVEPGKQTEVDLLNK